MRNILLALLLANILYAFYQGFYSPPPQAGEVVLDPDRLGPPLVIASQATIDAAESAAALRSIEEPRSIELTAAVGRSCVSIGPFKSGAEAGEVLSRVVATGLPAQMRSTAGQVFIGHWVQIRDIDNRDTGNQMIDTLRSGGLGDAYLVDAEGEGLKISLGLFGEMERAERIELQAKSLGLQADISARTRDALVFFVDVGLLPGRGAGAFVEEYGEEKVLLRERATCPAEV